MLGFLDADDPTNVPLGLAATARNCMFDLTSVRTRDGFQLQMQGLDESPISGMLSMNYHPVTADESFFQLPIISQLSGNLQYEKPLGTGKMVPFPTGLFVPPANSHMIHTEPYNRVYMAWSNLTVPSSQMCVVNPKTLEVDPYGMKPFGWNWLPSTQVLVGEVATPANPAVGNGHTYRCTVAGTTGTNEPTWTLGENQTVVDGTVTWEEYTAVMANRLPTPPVPALTRVPGGGTFPAGRDVYFCITALNGMGESLASVTVLLSNTNLNDAVNVVLPALAAWPGWVQGLASPYAITGMQVYERDVAHGAPAPPLSLYQRVAGGPYAPGATVTVTATIGSGHFLPTINSARVTPGQLPTPSDLPVIQRIPSGGTFAVSRDVYVLQTYSNANGETPAGPPNMIVGTQASDGIGVTVAAPPDFPQITRINLYEADVATGLPAPPSTQFALVGTYGPGSTPTIANTATGPPPPLVNGTGPGGNIVADDPQGGINGGPGFRYAAICFENRNFSISGFTASSVIQYEVDEDGWEIGVFNVTPGPGNIIARQVLFAVADGTSAGPFYSIGNINPQVPTQNFVYPQTLISDQVSISSTIFLDNTTTSGTFNFTDEYLIGSNDLTDRLKIIWPAQCVHAAYHKSVDRIFQTGMPGNWSGCRVSLAAAPEDYYNDTSAITVQSEDGQRAWGTIEYRQTSYLLRERGGMVLTANPNNPNTWSARGRWNQVGPCGPRAFDACDKFLMFVHWSGIYKYEDEVDLMSKEIPYFWQQVNWAAATTISCKIDYVTHQVQILLPINGSMVPNCKLMLNFEEGWGNPIHFSTYSGREISMDACRKYSLDDCDAYVCDRLYRTLPPSPEPVEGDDNLPLTSSAFQNSQFCYGSSGPDGQVVASQPGTFDDQGMGIDWVYETVAPQQTMAQSKIEGVSLNIRGAGLINLYALAARKSMHGQPEGGGPQTLILQHPRPLDLDVEQDGGISRAFPDVLNEKWRVRLTNGKVPGAWASLKWMSIYTIPMYSGRTEGKGG